MSEIRCVDEEVLRYSAYVSLLEQSVSVAHHPQFVLSITFTSVDPGLLSNEVSGS